MTQYAKEDIRNQILAAAREEFIKQGFEKASIRTITAAAGTAKSNLYNYFADKDALFCAVLEPVVTDIRTALEAAQAENEGRGTESYSQDSQERYMRLVMQYVASHTADISMLLFSAAGSSLAGFKDEVIDRFTGILTVWLAAAMPGHAPSRLFVRCVAEFYLSVVVQMLQQRPTMQEAQAYMGEFLKFVYGGWHHVMSSVD